MTSSEIIKKLKTMGSSRNIAGMARFGINPKNTLGVPVPELRRMAKEIGKDHELALRLWDSGIHEAKALASMVDIPKEVSRKQMRRWIKDFDSWDVCDQTCTNLFVFAPGAYNECFVLAKSNKEFVKRTAFALMACFAFKDKKMKNKEFIRFFPVIKKAASDERNFVRKAVNWALRQIGKRNLRLNKEAIKIAQEIKKMDYKSAKWIANDALRELQSEVVLQRLRT